MIVYLVQIRRRGLLAGWVLDPDFPAYDSREQAEATLESWLDGDYTYVVSRLGGIDNIDSMRTYQSKRGPVARIIGLRVAGNRPQATEIEPVAVRSGGK